MPFIHEFEALGMQVSNMLVQFYINHNKTYTINKQLNYEYNQTSKTLAYYSRFSAFANFYAHHY